MTEHARRPLPPRERQRLRDETAKTLDATAAGPVTAEASARASSAGAEAKVLAGKAGVDVAGSPFDVAGSSAARAALDLNWHRRNACVGVLHGLARWKDQAVGRHHMTGERSPRHGTI